MKNLTSKGKFLTMETFYPKIYNFPNSVSKIASVGKKLVRFSGEKLLFKKKISTSAFALINIKLSNQFFSKLSYYLTFNFFSGTAVLSIFE